jgi:hypothetical protein
MHKVVQAAEMEGQAGLSMVAFMEVVAVALLQLLLALQAMAVVALSE